MKIKVQLSGGIGNQLFQYFEGVSRATDGNETLELDFRDVYLGKINHNSYLTSISLPVKANYVNLNPHRFTIHIGKASKSLRNKLGSNSNTNESLRESLVNAIQNNAFFEKVIREFPNWKPELSNPSPWFNDMKKLLKEEDFISIHIRRGDYILQRNFDSIGVLSPIYYKNAIDLLESKVGALPIYVFSDYHLIQMEMENVLPVRTRYINPPNNTDSAESMMLMSYARGLVISNSTFSWWSARFAQDESMIIVPKPWFKSLPEPRNLIPLKWCLLESEWIDSNE